MAQGVRWECGHWSITLFQAFLLLDSGLLPGRGQVRILFSLTPMTLTCFSWPTSESFPKVRPGKRGCSNRRAGCAPWSCGFFWGYCLCTNCSSPDSWKPLEGREWRLVSTQVRPLLNWKVCGASVETPDFLLYHHHPAPASCFPLLEILCVWGFFFFPAVPKSFYSVGYISSCLLEELNCGYKHMNVKPPQGPPSSLCLGRYSKPDKAIWPISSAV